MRFYCVALYEVTVKFLSTSISSMNTSNMKVVTISLLQWVQASSSNCRVTLQVCGFTIGRQDNWLITQHISRMVNGTALQQVTVQVEF